MEQTKPEIQVPIQSSKENQTLSVQPKRINEMSTKAGFTKSLMCGEETCQKQSQQSVSCVEMSVSPNSTFSLINNAEKVETSNMAGVVNGGMNNTTNNYFVSLHPEFQSDTKSGDDLTLGVDSEIKFRRTRRESETEISLGTRKEVFRIKSTVTEDTDYKQSGQPKNDTHVKESNLFIDGVDGIERRLTRRTKVGKAETDPLTETSQSTATCSSSALVVGCPAMEIPNDYNIPFFHVLGLTSQELESNFQNQSNNNVISQRNGGSESRHINKTTSTPVCSPSIELNPGLKSSKKEPRNTVAGEPKEGQLSAGGGSLTCFSSVREELEKMNDKKRFMVEDIFKQLVTLAENHPNSTMRNISSFISTCRFTNHPEEDWCESVRDNFTSLTDFKELEKKLRTLDDRILNFDFPRVVYIARFKPQMLVEILKHLHSLHAVGVKVDDGWGLGTWTTFILSIPVMLIMAIALMTMMDRRWLMKHE